MDLETFFTTLYVLVDDWYKACIEAQIVKHAGASPKLGDSEVLTIALAGQWRVGVPWQSERGLVRWIQQHGRGMFPQMIGRSAFNARVRWLWGAFIRLQQVVAEVLQEADNVYACLDCVPLPAFSSGQAAKEAGHWLWESRPGHGGNWGSWYIGDKLLTVVTPQGAVTGWIMGSADIQDRWLLEVLLSGRAGLAQLRGPAPSPHASHADRAIPPVGHIGPLQAVGGYTTLPYLADPAFNSRRWQQHWLDDYGATVISRPQPNDPDYAAWTATDRRWLARLRQVIETAFAFLSDVFGLPGLNAHSRWGQYTRVAAKMAAYNIGLYINRWLGRPLGTLATLLC